MNVIHTIKSPPQHRTFQFSAINKYSLAGQRLVRWQRCLCELTNSTEKCFSWESNKSSASQEIPRIWGNPKVH
jgi:hypothetical protein